MSDETTPPAGGERGGDRRDMRDRRRRDRRRSDRRTPQPWWRRPWAYVGYGITATLALVLVATTVFSGEDDLGDPPVDGGETAGADAPGAAYVVADEAYGREGYEHLVVAGDDALRRVYRTELFCGAPTRIALNRPERAEAPIRGMADAEGSVPAAECKWGQAGDTRRPDFLLLLPRDMADEFAAAPEVTDAFVSRRHVHAEVEWLGRTEALALRPAGVLRRIVPE